MAASDPQARLVCVLDRIAASIDAIAAIAERIAAGLQERQPESESKRESESKPDQASAPEGDPGSDAVLVPESVRDECEQPSRGLERELELESESESKSKAERELERELDEDRDADLDGDCSIEIDGTAWVGALEQNNAEQRMMQMLRLIRSGAIGVDSARGQEQEPEQEQEQKLN